MKKILLFLMTTVPLLCFGENSKTNGSEDGYIVFRSVYYGTEASTHPNNPCKGATTRKCAEIESNIKAISSQECTVMIEIV